MKNFSLTPEQEKLWEWANKHLYGIKTEEEALTRAKKGERFNSNQLGLLVEYWSITMGYSTPNFEEEVEEEVEEDVEEEVEEEVEEDPADQLGLNYYGDEH